MSTLAWRVSSLVFCTVLVVINVYEREWWWVALWLAFCAFDITRIMEIKGERSQRARD